MPTEAPAVSVFRPPRFGDPLTEDVLEVPSPPTKNRPSPMPWAMLMLPMVMGVALFARSRSAYAIIYMLAWPILGFLGWRQQKRAAQKQFEEELADWRADVDDFLTAIDEHAVRQRQQFHDDYPDAETLRTRAADRDPYLWARSRDPPGVPGHPPRHRHRAGDAARRHHRRRRPATRREVAEEFRQRDDAARHAACWPTSPSTRWSRSPASPARSTPWCAR